MSNTSTPAKSRVQWVSITATAEELDVTTRTVRNMIARGDLPAYRLGSSRTVKIKASDIDAAMRRIPTVEPRLDDGPHTEASRPSPDAGTAKKSGRTTPLSGGGVDAS